MIITTAMVAPGVGDEAGAAAASRRATCGRPSGTSPRATSAKGEKNGPHAVHGPVRDGGVVRFFELVFQPLHRSLEEQKRDERPERLPGEARETRGSLRGVEKRQGGEWGRSG